jgi:acyl-CoA synthetase (AMP-forming)/AMP-acid ligase II/acyl carrier protein
VNSVTLSEARTIPALLAEQATQHAGSTALIDAEGIAISYDALWLETEKLAQHLQPLVSSSDATRLPRLGIVMPNGLDISIALLATTRFATAVPFNPVQTRVEFEAQFEATRVDAILLPEGVTSGAVEAANTLSLPLLRITQDRCVLPSSKASTTELRVPDTEDTALVLMTSGSTGKPKIVPLSHRNLCRSAFDVANSLNLTPRDRCLVMWEQFHIGGLVDLLIAPLAAGSSLVAAGSFDAARFFDLQAQHRATWFQGVPTSLGELVHYAKRKGLKEPLPGLRFLRSVAAALSPAAQERLVTQFGVPVVRTLGMTEAGPLITTTAPTLQGNKAESVGRSAGPEITILSDTGTSLNSGETGQIAIRGENVFAGYENNPDANQAAFNDGWFLTGDLGYLDDEGDLFLTGRAKEMINRGGEKIFPNEVEDALMAHPGVHEAACFAIPHATLGEDIACALATDENLCAQDIRTHLADRVARHKIPGQIEFLPQLPRNPVGKIDRQTLATHIASRSQASPAPKATFTPMQTLVADVWKEELSIVQVGLDEDFASVDGDSLSAVRILVSLETHFGTTLPEEIVQKFATVRELADVLELHGFDASQNNAEITPVETKTSVLLKEQLIFSGDHAEAKDLITRASGSADMRLKLDYLVTHLAPADVISVLNALRKVTPGAANGISGFFEKLRLKQELSQQRRNYHRYLPKGDDNLKWQRQDRAPGVMLYSDPTTPTAKKDLIVGFSGNRMRLLMPIYRVLRELNPSKYDLLLLADHSRNLFLKGIPTVCDDINTLAVYISQLCADAQYNRLLGIGTSGGSIAAVATGIAAGFDTIASIAPASLDKHIEWSETFDTIAPLHDPDQTAIRIVYGRETKQRAAADSIIRHVPLAEAIRYPHTNKLIFPDAQERGILGNLMEEWLA